MTEEDNPETIAKSEDMQEVIPVDQPVVEEEKNNDTESKKDDDEKPKKEEKSVEEVIVISAWDLYNAYEDNEVAADLKYKNKILEVTGTISDFGVDVFGTAFIMLDTGGPFKDTQVFFKKGQEEKIAELSKGEKVTVLAKGGGLIITSVVLNKGEIK